MIRPPYRDHRQNGIVPHATVPRFTLPNDSPNTDPVNPMGLPF